VPSDADTPIPPLPAVSPPARPNVLIVDDESAIRMIARFVLEGAGYAVTEAGSAADALARLRGGERAFTVILLDYTLPDCNGTDLVPDFRVLAPGSQVVLTSGRAEEDVPEHGADAYLPKPFNREQLLTVVRAVTAAAR
jgi:CheY-like chemotaxis protein